MKEKLKKFECLKPFGLEIALLTAVFSLAIQPLFLYNGYGVFNRFGRVFGHATLFGIDAQLRINHFTLFVVIGLPLLAILSALIVYWFAGKAKETSEDVREYLHGVSVVGFALVFVYLYGKYDKRFLSLLQDYGLSVIGIIAFSVLFYIKTPFMSFEKFKFAIFLSIALAFLSDMLFARKAAPYGDKVIVYLFLFMVMFVMAQLLANRLNLERLQTAALPVFFAPAIGAVYLEMTNILNQHSVFIIDRLFGLKLLMGITIAASVVLYKIAKTGSTKHYNIGLIGLIAGIAMFANLPPLHFTAGTELFEQANHGMLANDVLRWGKLPIINSFDGHMLAYSLGELLFGFLNGDVLGASYAGYNVFAVIAAVMLFFVLKRAFNREFAFFFALFVPRFLFVFPLHDIGLTAIAALLYALEKRTVKSFVLLFLSVVFLALYEVPTGFSYGGGAFLLMFAVLVADFVKERRAIFVKKFLISFVVFAASCAAVFVILCLVQGVHPFKRALEFLGLCLSTNNWTPWSVGATASRSFALMYSLLPIAAIAGSIGAVINFKKDNKYAVSLALFIAYFMNYSRALGRHSLAENRYGNVVWTCVLALMFLFAAIKPKTGKQLFVASGVALMLLFGVSGVYEYKSTLQHAYGNVISPAAYRDGADEKITRVNLSAPFETHKEVIAMLNTFVPPGETYMDLSSQTMLYALTGREKPVYVNQSPLHLSGEFTQKMFIEQIEKFGDKCSYALLGGYEDLDDIWTQYRYYYVYEYLYENYRPLCKTSTMFLWVKKDKYNDAVQKLSAGNSFAFEPIDYTYRDASYHTYNLAEIPYLWGTYDSKTAYKNAVVTSVTDGLIPASKQSRSNYILLTLNADTPETGTLVLADINGNPLAQYSFTLHRGTARYLFRVSSDWYWDNGQDVHAGFQTPANAQGEITLLAGD